MQKKKGGSRGRVGAAVLAAAAACAPRARPDTVWLMPEPRHEEPAPVAEPEPEPEPPDARTLLPRGHRWADAQATGSDVVMSDSHAASRGAGRGDPPETAFDAGVRTFWRRDEARALAEARASGRWLLVDFMADWCVPCLLLDREVFGDPEVRARLEPDFVPLRVDVTEETMANRAQMERYGVVRLPAVLVLDAHGREVDRIEHPLDAESFLARLARARGKM
jgi:thiol:disulfide interchange protein DsbD